MKAKKNLILLMSFALLFGCSTKEKAPQGNVNYRDNTPHIYTPEASGEITIGNQKVTIDISHTSLGYIMVEYHGNNPKVKVRITNPDTKDMYTYDKHEGYDVFPLTGGNGSYSIQVYENVNQNQYSTLYSDQFDVQLENEFTTFLYPSQYVNYTNAPKTIELGKELAKETTNELDVVENVYEYLKKNIKYDDDKASLVQAGQLNGYIPDIDEILEKKKGICFDYTALMATMLRTQNIPTRMQIGYAINNEDVSKSIYHAWIGVYIQDIGWIDHLIEFDGHSWKLMDPTFASQSNSKETRNYISNEKNYQTKYYY